MLRVKATRNYDDQVQGSGNTPSPTHRLDPSTFGPPPAVRERANLALFTVLLAGAEQRRTAGAKAGHERCGSPEPPTDPARAKPIG
jgi:hypothetical protein